MMSISFIEDSYEASNNIIGSICPNKYEDNIRNFMKLINPKIGEKILLIGDISSYGKYLKKRGADVTILEETKDYSKSAIVKNVNCNIVDGSLEFMPFKDDYFSKAIFLNHFNSFQDENKVFKEINRVLMDKGKIIIEESNPNKLQTKCKIITNKILGYTCKFYKPQELLDFFLSNGFVGSFEEVENDKYIYIGSKVG